MLSFIEFVPNGSTFNHPETVSLQATISFTNECLLYKIAHLVFHKFFALTLHLPCVRAPFCFSCLLGLLHVNKTVCKRGDDRGKGKKKKKTRSPQVWNGVRNVLCFSQILALGAGERPFVLFSWPLNRASHSTAFLLSYSLGVASCAVLQGCFWLHGDCACICHTKSMCRVLWLAHTWCSAPTSFILVALQCSKGAMEEQTVLH